MQLQALNNIPQHRGKLISRIKTVSVSIENKHAKNQRRTMLLFILCQLLMVGAPSNSNKLFGRLDADTLGRVSSFLTETASARVFRRVASNCNQGHRQQVHDKMDQFKSLLEQIEDKLPRATPAIAQKIHSLHRELRMSGLFAFEGPGILRRWIAKMRVSSVENQRKIPMVMAAIPGLCEMEESANEGMTPRMKGFVDLLIENSQRVFRDLVSPHFEDLAQRASALLLHEYLFWSDYDPDWFGLPEMSEIFSCDGEEREKLRHLVENRGHILIHPFHWDSLWKRSPIVHNRRLLDQICSYGTRWVLHKKMSYEQAGRSTIRERQFKLFQTEWPTWILIKVVENIREPMFWRQGVQAMNLQIHIEWLLSGHVVEDAPVTPWLFDVLMKRDLVAFSMALGNVMTNPHHSGVFVNHRTNDDRCRIHCKLLGNAVDVLISGGARAVERFREIDCEWARILSSLAMRWINVYRMIGVHCITLLDSSDGLDSHLLLDDEALRMNEENLRKIQDAFPWLMPEGFVQTLLLAQQDRVACNLDEGTTYDPESILSFYQ